MPPIPGFYFRVVFELVPNFPIDTKFQSVAGLKATIETEDIQEGGQNRISYALPKKTKFEDIVLTRGLTSDLSALRTWCQNAIDNFVFVPANAVISLLNQDNIPIKVWYVSQAIPVALSLSEFKAEENSIVIETLTLKPQFFKEMPMP